MFVDSFNDTIVAPATPIGVSAISIVRISGNDAVAITDKCFSKSVKGKSGYTIHYGFIKDGDTTIDEVLVSLFLTHIPRFCHIKSKLTIYCPVLQ